MRHRCLLTIFALIIVPAAARDFPAAAPGGSPVVILAPLPDSAAPGGEPLEISLLLEGLSGLDLRLSLDGEDVTARAEITGEYVFCLVDPAPAAGPHTVSFAALDGADTVAVETWPFTIAAAAPQDSLDDLPSDTTAPPVPFFLSVSAGAQYGACRQDTAGLGLTYPIGAHPVVELSASGPLAGGSFSGYASYDRSYDTSPHGLLQADLPWLELSLGEFYPDVSELAFSGVTPLGGVAAYRWPRAKLGLVACRTQSADTGYQTFSQYLYGAQAEARPLDSLRLTAGYLRGFDRASSLPDSVRYARSVFVYTDTVLGLTDSVVTVDTLHTGRNRILWGGARYGWPRLAVGAEFAAASLLPDTGGAVAGIAYSLAARLRLGRHGVEAALTSVGDDFRSFGNPYAEASRDEFSVRQDSRWNPSLSTAIDGALYTVASDSADGISRRLGAGLTATLGAVRSASLRLEYGARPYTAYLSQTRTASLSGAVAAGTAWISPSYAYSSASGDRLSQSHTAALDLSLAAGTRLRFKPGIQYCQVRDDRGTSDQDKTTLLLGLGWDATAWVTVDLTARHIAKNDRIDPAQSYRQSLFSALLTAHF
ncbi:MAG: hypothetical protein MUF78_02035 [Candidatus Edwardsbacteria bacterium]|jgi:hypothetical protein|nr:hypothetical protein [Candidatus Edwardsbacteria bacterium]